MPDEPATLDGRVALVTGAGGSAGRAVARELARRGARLALVGRRIERLEELAGALGLPRERALCRAVDLRDRAAADALVAAILARFGRLDILAHLVGGWTGGASVVDAPEADFAAMLEQHLWTTLHVVRATVPLLRASGWGRIVAVSSPAAAEPPAGGAPYAVGKAAEEALLVALSRELAGSGVTVNVLRVRAIDVDHARAAAPSPENAGWTTPEELAAAVAYLCSDPGAAISGARLALFGAH